jgi:hypothetical protein
MVAFWHRRGFYLFYPVFKEFFILSHTGCAAFPDFLWDIRFLNRTSCEAEVNFMRLIGYIWHTTSTIFTFNCTSTAILISTATNWSTATAMYRRVQPLCVSGVRVDARLVVDGLTQRAGQLLVLLRQVHDVLRAVDRK